MKKFKFVILCFLCFTLTGCKTDDMENIKVYTSTYPIEYITKYLYGDRSKIYSIYPNEVIDLSDKLINNYSNSDLFVYNGLSNEKDYAVKMLNNNKNLKIVDSTMGMEIENSIEELWLNPSDFLMLSLNIRNGMKEYITNSILRNEIDNNYDKLKVEVSELDAEIKLLVQNAKNNSILVSNDLFNFMTKYDLKVYSLNNMSDKNKSDIEDLIKDKVIKHVIVLDNEKLTEEMETFITDNNLEKLTFNSLTTLSSDDRSVGKDYLSIMMENLDLLKQELYD